MPKPHHVLIALFLLCATSAGLFLAWNHGLLGKWSGVPSLDNVKEILSQQAAFDALQGSEGRTCLKVEMNEPAPERLGAPGIEFRMIPGQHDITLTIETDQRRQARRARQLKQLSALAKAGLVTEEETTLDRDGKRLTAKRYKLTWEGFSAVTQPLSNSLCLFYGRHEPVAIEKVDAIESSVADLRIYRVAYRTALADPPPWVTLPEMLEAFPQLADLTAPRPSNVDLVRSEDKWMSLFTLQREIARVSSGNKATSYDAIQRALDQFRSETDIVKVQQLLQRFLASTDWLDNQALACLPISLGNAADERPRRSRDMNAPYVLAYQDRLNRSQYEAQAMATELHVLSALESSGLATVDGSVPGIVRFTIKKEAVEDLGLQALNRVCLPLGQFEVDLLPLNVPLQGRSARLRGKVKDTPALAAKLAEALPAARSVLEYGIAFDAIVSPVTDPSGGEQSFSSVHPHYPVIKAAEIPLRFQPLLPYSHAVLTGNQDDMLALRNAPPTAGRSTAPGSIGDLSVAGMPTATVVSVPPAALRDGTNSALLAARLRKQETSPIHVISIYEPYAAGRDIDVTVAEKDAVLVLTAYEAVTWRIRTENGGSVKRVIAFGYHQQSVTADDSNVEIFSGKRDQIPYEYSSLTRREYPSTRKANSLVQINSTIQETFGATPATFQASYRADPAGFRIDAKVPRFRLPTPQAPPEKPTAIALKASVGDSAYGTILRRGSAGALTDASANRSYSAGRVYFEGVMRVTGSLVAHTHANIGLCLGADDETESEGFHNGIHLIPHAEQERYRDGDRFGLAADLDGSRLYVRINGQWKTGVPGSGDGLTLQPGMFYRACAAAAGTTSGEEPRSDTTWELNFGAKPYSDGLPVGYQPYNGGPSG